MIESIYNEQVKYVVSLQRRKVREQTKSFVIEGWRFVKEAAERKAPIEKIYVCPERESLEWQPLAKHLQERNISFEEVDKRVLRKMTATEEPQGILAVVRQTDYSWSDLRINAQTVLLIIDGLQDPGNLGTILRTALASGVRYVCLTPGTVDIYNSKVLRSTMGAVFPLVLLPNQRPDNILTFCREQGLSILTGDTQGQAIYETALTEGPYALVVGNEGKGPSPAFRGANVRQITIPMLQNVESLNVAVATGIMLYEIVRQRDFL